MGTYSAALAKAAPEVDLFTESPEIHEGPAPSYGSGPYAELAERLFGQAQSAKVVAFASATPAEGVTRTVQKLAGELIRDGKTTICLDGALKRARGAGQQLHDESQSLILGLPMTPDLQRPVDVFATLRTRYDCVLLDCGAISRSMDLFRVAPSVDGVVLIVEAGRTGKDRVQRAAQVVLEARGTLLGVILTKRRYPIPNWLYRLL